jgi:hypothetical protein
LKLNEQERIAESFQYHREIAKPFGKLDDVVLWCKTELQGDWRWQLIQASTDQRPGIYLFYFDSERDCCAFTLKWI